MQMSSGARILQAGKMFRFLLVVLTMYWAGEAQAEKPKAGAVGLYQLGQTALQEGRLVEARDLMRRYLADPQVAASAESPSVQEARRVVLLPAPPAGEVALFGARGAQILVDERPVGTLPLALPLLCPIGSHKVALVQGQKRLVGKVAVRAGHVAEMRFIAETGAVLVTLLPAVLLVQRGVAPMGPEEVRFGQAVLQVLQAANYVVFPTAVALEQAHKPESCLSEPGCLVDVAERGGIALVLSLQVRAEGPAPGGGSGQWNLGMRFLDPRIAVFGAEAERDCAQCSLEAAAAVVGELTRQVMAQGPARARGTLVVRSTPPGAEVQEGERVVGVTPYQRPAYAGEHQLVLKRDGYDPEQTAVIVTAGQTATVDVALKEFIEPAPAPLVVPPEASKPRTIAVHRQRVEKLARPRWRLALGATALVLGVGLGVLGGSALAVDGRCVDAPAMEGGACREVLQTRAAGAGLLAVGAALTVGGVVGLALPGGQRTVDEIFYQTLPPIEMTKP